MRIPSIVVSFAVGLAACAPGAVAAQDRTRAAIEAANEKFEAAFNSGRTADLADLYAANGALLPPGELMTAGREAIAAFWQGVRDSGVESVALETLEVEAQEDLAYEMGRAELKVRAADGSTSSQWAKYLVVWTRADGEWQLLRDIWNADPES